MKLKLDENLPHDLATTLAARGHDVHTVVDEDLGCVTIVEPQRIRIPRPDEAGPA